MLTRTSRILLLVLSAALGACGRDKPAQDTPRDIALAPVPSAEPQLRDVPEPPPPPAKRSAPKPAPPPAVAVVPVPTPPPVDSAVSVAPPVAAPPAPVAPAIPAFGEIAPGTDFAVRTPAKLCTNVYKAGDKIPGTVSEAVYGTYGVVVPAGATATLQVTKSQYGKNDANAVKFEFSLVSVTFGGQTYDLTGADVIAPPITTVRRQTTTDQGKKVAAGAVIGAILGQVMGKNTKSTVAGAAAGAAGGAVVAAGTADYDGCVDTNVRLAVKLTQPLRIRTGS